MTSTYGGSTRLDDDAGLLVEAARSALVEFGLADAAAGTLERLPQQVSNVNFKVRSRGKDWVLKCHRAADAAERLAVTHALEAALEAAGFPVAKLGRTASGATYVRTDVGTFTLNAWVDGQQISIAGRDRAHEEHPELAAHLGRLVGDLHRIGTSAMTTAPTVDALAALLAGPRRTVASIRHGAPGRFRKVPRLLVKRDRTEFDRWILRHRRQLYRDAAALSTSETSALVSGEEFVLGHNDLNWENLVLDPELRVVAVLDFDNASLLPRALGVGAAAAVLVGGHGERIGAFVRAFEQAAGHAVDPRAVNVGMHWKCLRSTLWSIDSYLSGRATNTTLLGPWCQHLQECREKLPPVGEPAPYD